MTVTCTWTGMDDTTLRHHRTFLRCTSLPRMYVRCCVIVDLWTVNTPATETRRVQTYVQMQVQVHTRSDGRLLVLF